MGADEIQIEGTPYTARAISAADFIERVYPLSESDPMRAQQMLAALSIHKDEARAFDTPEALTAGVTLPVFLKLQAAAAKVNGLDLESAAGN